MTNGKDTLLSSLVTSGQDQAEAIDVGHGIYVNRGVGNSYLVTTNDGGVVVNAGTLEDARRGRQFFSKVSGAPIHFVILTQSHVNQYGGVECFMEDGTKLVVHREYSASRSYAAALNEYYDRRNRKLWGSIVGGRKEMAPTREIAPDVLIDDNYVLKVGGRRFELLSVPGGETRDSIVVWLPQDRVAIVGNLFGPIFGHQPNLNTVRGDKPRSALAFIESVKRVRALEPEVILTGHQTIDGRDAIQWGLSRLADAVQWLHDQTVSGMNEGKDVYGLMRDLKPPEEFQLGEGHGKAMWNVRAIWAEYTGWFDYDSTASLYPVSPRAVSSDLAELAGGADRLAERARAYLAASQPVEAIHLLDIALDAEPTSSSARGAMRDALQILLEQGGNRNLSETMWLRAEIASLGDDGGQ
jgi:alkyl sulfatase BDS1-like metallo-beta-lactamase superfamily hydrolase